MTDADIFFVGLIFVFIYASVELILKLIKKEPLWKTMKTWLKHMLDALSCGF